MLRPRFRRQYGWLLALIVVMTTVALLVGAIAIRYVESSLVTTTGDALALAANDIADKLSRSFFERYGDTQVLAQTSVLKDGDPAAIAGHLAAIQNAYPIYAWLGVVDAMGRIVAATDRSSLGRDQSSQPWFQAVRDGMVVHVQDAQLSEEAGGVMAVAFTAPIRGGAGQFLGAVTTRVKLQSLEDMFEETVRPLAVRQGKAALVEWQLFTRQGEVIVDSILRQEGQVNLKQLGLPSVQQPMAEGPGYVEEEHRRRHVLVVTGYAPVKGYREFAGLQWGVLVRMERRDIVAPMWAFLWKLGAVGAVLWGPMFGLLLWSVWRLKAEWARALEAEATVRESEQRIRTILETALDAVIVMRADGRIRDWNAQAEAMFGWSHEDAIGKLLSHTIVPPRHREAHERGLRHFLETGEGPVLNRRFEITACHRNGREFPVELTISPAQHEGVWTFSAFVRDITERLQSERALRESEEKFRLIMDHANDALFYLDTAGMVGWANRRAEAVTGRSMQELVGQPLVAILSPQSQALVEARLAAVRRDEPVTSIVELDVLRPDGRSVRLEVSASSVKAGANTVGRLLVARDLTERQKMEQQLRQVDKLAAMGTLLGGLAHELNNPLFAVTGYAQLMGEKVKLGQVEGLVADLAEMNEAAQRAKAIVERFLRIARPGGGSPGPCQVNALVEQALDLVANDCAIHRIVVRRHLQAGLLSVSADSADLTQVFLNLITNAEHAMVAAHGQGTLTVTTAPVSDRSGTWVEVCIADDGPGIAPEHQARIFEPFFTTKPVGQGTGLGLAICHRIVTELGGTLRVDSTEGQGATFIVRLPTAGPPSVVERSTVTGG